MSVGKELRIKNIISLLGIFTLLILLSGCSSEKQIDRNANSYLSLSINNIEIPVEMVDTAESRRLGLSYRESLDEGSGMLFDMKASAITSFWMKDMNFPLDIIWIDGDKIVNISKNLPSAGTHPSISYSSELPVDFVLEVNGGFCDKEGIETGDIIISNF